MNRTKHDLSYNSTKLDYQALIDTANIAVGHCVEKVSHYLSEFHKLDVKPTPSVTQWLEREGRYLAIANETLHTLREGLEREELEIINKPEVPSSE